MLTTYYVIWCTIGFMSWIIDKKLIDKKVEIVQVLYAVLFSFSGLAITLVMVITLFDKKKLLDFVSQIYTIKLLNF